MREPITLYKMAELRTMIHDGYHLQPHGRLAWLHRLLWRALVKMRAVGPAMKETVEVIRLPCDADGVLARIMEAREGMFRVHREPREVLIGPDTLSELMSTPEIRGWTSPFSIDAQAHVSRGFEDRPGSRRVEHRIFNLPIHVEPNMEGILVR